MAVGALVLGAESFFERRQRRAVEPAGGKRHAQLERLALIMQAGAAPDLDPLRGEPVRGSRARASASSASTIACNSSGAAARSRSLRVRVKWYSISA